MITTKLRPQDRALRREDGSDCKAAADVCDMTMHCSLHGLGPYIIGADTYLLITLGE